MILCLLAVLSASAQPGNNTCKGAIVKDRLVQFIRSNREGTKQLVSAVSKCGVDFQTTPAVESELAAAGARPELVEAVRNNYRPAVVGSNKNSNGVNKPDSKNFTGVPLSKNVVVTLLQNGVPDAQVRKNVESRGVDFQINGENAGEIKGAGGSSALLNLIAVNYVGGKETNASNNSSGGSSNYEDLISLATDQYDNKDDRRGAIETLQKAVKIAPHESRAFQLLGFMYLYGINNFADASTYFQQAINKGGNAVFRVYHDHDGVFTDVCKGSLYVSKDAVRFEGDDGQHTFETSDANIMKVKMNNSFKRLFQTKTGSFKIVLNSGEDKDGVKFSFAPLTDNELESKMIIRLIGKS